MEAETEQSGLRAHLQAGEGEEAQGQGGSIQEPMGQAPGSGMLKVPSSSFNVQQTDESTHPVHSGNCRSV